MRAVLSLLALLAIHGYVSGTDRYRSWCYWEPQSARYNWQTICNPYPQRRIIDRISNVVHFSTYRQSDVLRRNDWNSAPLMVDPLNMKSVKNGINKFAMDLYGAVGKGKLENIIFSPLSLYIILAMGALGAQGSTKDELWSLLHLPMDTYATKASLQAIVNEFESMVGSKIYVDTGVSLKPQYQEMVQRIFKSTIGTVNFNNQVEAANIINDWVRQSTHGLIDNLFDAASLDQNTLLLMINAVYYSAKWKFPFDKDEETQHTFTVSPGNEKNLPMMTITVDVKWGNLSNFRAKFIELPYELESTKAANMYIVLPEDNAYLADLEEHIGSLTLDDFAKVTVPRQKSVFSWPRKKPLRTNPTTPTTAPTGKVTVSLPRFSFSSSLNLENTLSQLGAPRAFSHLADFQLISNEALHIGDVLHKAFIKTNENGTTAVAVSVEDYFLKSGLMNFDPIPKFIVNQPFLVIIAVDDVIVFIGKVVDPDD